MKKFELIVNYATTDTKDYVIGFPKFQEESLEKLADLIGMDVDNVAEWFMTNAVSRNKKATATEFYNQTISRKDIEVEYYEELVAIYNDTEIVAVIDETQTEMYDNKEAQEILEETKEEKLKETFEVNGVEVNNVKDFENNLKTNASAVIEKNVDGYDIEVVIDEDTKEFVIDEDYIEELFETIQFADIEDDITDYLNSIY